MTKPFIVEEGEHEGKSFRGAYFFGDPSSFLLKQVQAVCFTGDDRVVLFRFKDGKAGCPGGSVESGESVEEALRREILEEANCELLDFGPTGYVQVEDLNSGRTFYQGRYWALVKPLEGEVRDPVQKSKERILVSLEEAPEVLGWGKKGESLIAEGYRRFREKHDE